MELLSARFAEFDLKQGLWKLETGKTKTKAYIEIPLTSQVIAWLEEAKVFACGSEYVFPARRLIRTKNGQPRKNRFEHVSPDTLNVALKRLPLKGIEHFTVHDMRRTARTQLGALSVDPFVAERALNHKIRGTQGIYDRHDYLPQRREALGRWAELLGAISRGSSRRPTPNEISDSAKLTVPTAPLASQLLTTFAVTQAANE